MTKIRLSIVAAILTGLTIGIGGYTFVYAKGYSYLTNDPAACANCHIMRDHFRAWTRASHRSVAVCNDCHTPPGLVPKYMTKARNGFWHSFYFTSGRYPDPLQITPRNRDATRQEMRAYVCGQCHVEYYFKGPEKRLTYPWDKGLKADEILAYYEENGFKDWTHAETGAPTLKAQHPEFEMWNQGIHARSGVACADCHMPYQRVGAMKISDHHVRSPMLNINRACQTCHRWSEDELRSRVYTIQDRTHQVRNVAMDALMALIADIKAAKAAGANDAALETSRRYQRRAQFLLDFIEAENSMGFHADQEAVRVLALSIDETRRGQASVPGSKSTLGARTDTGPSPQPVLPRASQSQDGKP